MKCVGQWQYTVPGCFVLFPTTTLAGKVGFSLPEKWEAHAPILACLVIAISA